MRTKRRSLADVHNISTATAWPAKNHKCFSTGVLWFVGSVTVTWAAFFAYDVPLYSVGVLFILYGLVARPAALGLIMGYWSVAIGLACYTLFNLTGSALVAVVLLAASLGLLFALHFKFGQIIPLLVLAFVPWLPGHPLVVTAGLIPDAGFYGLGILGLSIAVIEKAKTPLLKATAVLILASVATMAQLQHIPISGTFTARPLVPVKALSDISKWRQILERIPQNTVVVMGENNFNTSDRDISNLFCAAAAKKNTVIYTGLFNAATETPEVWAFDPTCLPQRQYTAMLRAPVNLAALKLARRTSTGPYNWLICFEAFSLWRWGTEITNEIDVLFVISQDRWAEPFNIPLLRKKIVSGFAAAFGFDYALAETERSMVIRNAH